MTVLFEFGLLNHYVTPGHMINDFKYTSVGTLGLWTKDKSDQEIVAAAKESLLEKIKAGALHKELEKVLSAPEANYYESNTFLCRFFVPLDWRCRSAKKKIAELEKAFRLELPNIFTMPGKEPKMPEKK